MTEIKPLTPQSLADHLWWLGTTDHKHETRMNALSMLVHLMVSGQDTASDDPDHSLNAQHTEMVLDVPDRKLTSKRSYKLVQPNGGPRVLRTRPGPQTEFLASDADVTLWISSSDDAGKTWGLFADATASDSLGSGWHGLVVGASRPHVVDLHSKFVAKFTTPSDLVRHSVLGVERPSGAALEFRHVVADNDLRDMELQGRELAWIGIDQCQAFAADTVRYLMTRLRAGHPTLRMVGTGAPRGMGGPLIEALTRKSGPGPGASWIAIRHGRVVFGPTREATAELMDCPHEAVRSFSLITGP